MQKFDPPSHRYLRSAAKLRAKASATQAPFCDLINISIDRDNPGALRMHFYAPSNLPPGAPLVVALHGCNQSAAEFDNAGGWTRRADRHRFAVLLPEQTAENNPNSCFNWFRPGDVARAHGEVRSIRRMIELATERCDADPGRVFIVGFSAGGAMATAMLATYPEVFSAGAVVAGLPYGAASSLPEALDAMFNGRSRSSDRWAAAVRSASPWFGPWPRISIWHGDVDETVVPSNSGELAKQWTTLHGLTRPLQGGPSQGEVRRVEWRGDGGEVVVEHVLVNGLRHCIPVRADTLAARSDNPFLQVMKIDALEEICRFWGLAPDDTSTATFPKESEK